MQQSENNPPFLPLHCTSLTDLSTDTQTSAVGCVYTQLWELQ